MSERCSCCSSVGLLVSPAPLCLIWEAWVLAPYQYLYLYSQSHWHSVLCSPQSWDYIGEPFFTVSKLYIQHASTPLLYGTF